MWRRFDDSSISPSRLTDDASLFVRIDGFLSIYLNNIVDCGRVDKSTEFSRYVDGLSRSSFCCLWQITIVLFSSIRRWARMMYSICQLFVLGVGRLDDLIGRISKDSIHCVIASEHALLWEAVLGGFECVFYWSIEHVFHRSSLHENDFFHSRMIFSRKKLNFF